MSFQFIIGGSGSGKSHRLYRKVIEESKKHPERKYLILVPEQFTMQTQKELVCLHPKHGIMNIDVLSFERLAYHVFDEVGGSQRTVLEETGKSLVIRRLAIQNKERLSVLGSKLGRMGYVGEMKSILSELAQYNVSRDQLLLAAEEAGDNRLLKEKLQDILVLQDAFREYKEERYITSEEVLELLCRVADQSSMLKDCVAVLDGFTGFTPIQYVFLRKLMECAREVTVTVTMDVREYPFTALHEEELFALSKQTIWELRRIAQECGVREEEPLLLPGPRFQSSRAMAFLEQHILRYDGAVFEGTQDNIRLCRASDPGEEVLFAAREICRLVYEEGFRYRDIAVITADMDGYRRYIKRQFDDSAIPCFIDYKRDILSNPVVEFLRAALQMVDEDFSYESVFRYLRCGLAALSQEAVDRMDNYCRAMGIRGYRVYEREWTGTYQGQDPEELKLLNQIREEFLSQVKEFKERYAKSTATVRDRTEGLYRWCERLNIQEQLLEYEKAFLAENKQDLAKEYAQVYRIVMELFDKLVELMGDEMLPLKEYGRILDAGFEEARVGIIPPGTDQVVVGDMERTRLKDIRVLFVLGVNDGIIPITRDAHGILSALDRESLKGMRIHLSPDRKENAWIQQFYLYINLTKPSERLYVSYSLRNRKGELLRPSYLVGMIRELFPGIGAENREGNGLLSAAASRRQGLVNLALAVGEDRFEEPDAQKLSHYFLKDAEGRRKMEQLLHAAEARKSRLALDRSVAKALYGEELTGSVTRLEKYASCAYAHFLSYGLRLKERKEYTFAALDLGNILHRALELYTEELERGPYTWFDVPQKEQELLMDGCVEQVAADYGNTILLSSFRNNYMLQRMKQMGRRTVWAVTEQVRRGKFVPRGFEVEFSAADHLSSVSFLLKDNTRMKLTGRIDRSDVYEDENSILVKVVDYKTGAKSFDAGEVYYGLSLQLAVYMNAAMEMEQRTHGEKLVIPAAMLYYQMKDPILETEASLTEEAMQDARLKELCTRGLVNSNPDIIQLLDKDEGKGVPVIPASVTKSGSLSARSSAADTSQIRQLLAHVQKTMRIFGEEIMDGNISAAPGKQGTLTACDYCLYKGICGFDPKLPGCSYQKFPSLSPAQVWDRLKEEDGSEERPENTSEQVEGEKQDGSGMDG